MSLPPSSTPHTIVVESLSSLSLRLHPFYQCSPHHSLCGHYKSLHTTLLGHESWLPKIHLLHCAQNNMYLNTSQIMALYWERPFPWFLLPSSLAWHIPLTLWLWHCLLVQPHLNSLHMLPLKWYKEILKYAHFVKYLFVVEVWRVEKNGEEDLGNGMKW